MEIEKEKSVFPTFPLCQENTAKSLFSHVSRKLKLQWGTFVSPFWQWNYTDSVHMLMMPKASSSHSSPHSSACKNATGVPVWECHRSLYTMKTQRDIPGCDRLIHNFVNSFGKSLNIMDINLYIKSPTLLLHLGQILPQASKKLKVSQFEIKWTLLMDELLRAQRHTKLVMKSARIEFRIKSGQCFTLKGHNPNCLGTSRIYQRPDDKKGVYWAPECPI